MNNRLIEIFSKNQKASNEVSMMLLQYFCFKKDEKLDKEDLKLFLEKEELNKLSKDELDRCLQKLKELKKSLYQQQKAYSQWIYDNTKVNMLKAKESQYGLPEEEKEKVSFALANAIDKLNMFDWKIFKLLDIQSLDDFINLLNNTEPLYAQAYRKEKNFFDTDFLFKLNNINTDELLKEGLLDFNILDFLKSNIFCMEDEIEEELFESLLEKFKKGFLHPQNQKPARFFALLSKITSLEIAAFNTFAKGLKFG